MEWIWPPSVGGILPDTDSIVFFGHLGCENMFCVLSLEAIHLCKDVFYAVSLAANDLRSHVDAAKLNPFDHFLHTFAPRDTLVKQGDVMKRSNLAATLELIKDDGPDAFYNGPLGERFVDMVSCDCDSGERVGGDRS